MPPTVKLDQLFVFLNADNDCETSDIHRELVSLHGLSVISEGSSFRLSEILCTMGITAFG